MQHQPLYDRLHALVGKPFTAYMLALDDAYENDPGNADYAKLRHAVSGLLRNTFLTVPEHDFEHTRAVITSKLEHNIALIAHSQKVPEAIQTAFVAALREAITLVRAYVSPSLKTAANL